MEKSLTGSLSVKELAKDDAIKKAEKNNKSNLKDQTKTKKQITEQGQLVEKIRKQLESMR